MRTTKSGQKRPTCPNIGCNRGVQEVTKSTDGVIKWRTFCAECHRYPLNARPGTIPVKKRYCENHDGYLGFECGCTNDELPDHLLCGLEVDHIDGDKYNNVPENLQTLCKGAHGRKTSINGEYGTKYNVNDIFIGSTYNEIFVTDRNTRYKGPTVKAGKKKIVAVSNKVDIFK